MLMLRVRDLRDSAHNGPESHEHVRVGRHLGDGQVYSIQSRH